MIVSIDQPHYLPWLGYFHRLAASDLHIILDHVQFEKNSFINRNKVRTYAGWTWLTVPVRTSGRFGNLSVDTIEIADERTWASKHWKTLKFGYGNAPYFDDYADPLESIYKKSWPRLIDLIDASTSYLLKELGVETERIKGSALGMPGHKSELVLNLCEEVGAEIYLSGPLGRDYLDEAAFHDVGIRIVYQDYNHPVYNQVHPGFESQMSIVDLLLNCGENSLEVLMEGNPASQDIRALGVTT